MGLFSTARMPPPATASSAAHGLISSQHTSGIYADMTVDGEETGTLVVVIDRAKNLPNLKTMGKQDPYCAARLGKEAKKTDTDRRGGQTPRWDQELRFTVRDGADYGRIKISVFNDDKRTDLIGETWVMLDNVLVAGGGQADSWHNLTKQGKYAGEIRIELTYYDTRPKQEKPKRAKSVETEDVQRAAVPGPREPPALRRRPLPAPNTTSALPDRSNPPPQEPTNGSVPQPLSGPRSFHTPPRHASGAYDDEFPTAISSEHHEEQYDDPVGQQNMQHPHSRSMPDILSGQYPEAVESQIQHEQRAPPQHRHSSFDPYSAQSHDNSFSEDDSFQYTDDPYALQAAEAVHEPPQQHAHYVSQPVLHSNHPPRHDRVQALAPQYQQQHVRPLPQPSHSAPLPNRQGHAYPIHQDNYQNDPSHGLGPQTGVGLGLPRRANTYDDFGHQDQYQPQHQPQDMEGPPPPPRHRASIPPPQHQAFRPQPVHYNSQPVQPVTTPPYPRNRDSWDPSSEHAASLRRDYAVASDPYYQQPRPRQPPLQQPPSHDPRYHERRRSAEPSHFAAEESFTDNPYGQPAPAPYQQHMASHSSPVLPRSNFPQSSASSAVLRTPNHRSVSREFEDVSAPVEEQGRSPEPHRVNATNVPLHKPQARSGQLASQPVIINGTVALGTRASPLYSSPNPSAQRIPRRSISPNATTEATGTHYSPDSYNVYNPNARSTAADASPTAHRSPSPMYSSDVDGPSPNASPSKARTTADGNVILSDGRVVHPSDHLPSSAWAPEPEQKNKRPTVAVNIKNRFGPRDARTLDGPSSTVVYSPLAGAGMRKPAEAAPMSNPPVRVRRMGPLGHAPGRENMGAPPPIPAKVPLGYEQEGAGGGSLADEMAKIDLGPRRKKMGWGTGNRWGV